MKNSGFLFFSEYLITQCSLSCLQVMKTNSKGHIFTLPRLEAVVIYLFFSQRVEHDI